MARIVACPGKQHVREHHPDSSRSEDEIRQLVAQVVKDA